MEKEITLTLGQLFEDITRISLDIIETIPNDALKNDRLMVALLLSYTDAIKRGLNAHYTKEVEYDA